ncbi:MAG: hypothetical protein ACLFQP_00830 [Halothece sp.]
MKSLLIGSAIALLFSQAAIAQSSCPSNINTLAENLLEDVPNYANRIIQRTKSPSRSQTNSTYFIIAGNLNSNPLEKEIKGDYTPAFPNSQKDNVEQIFFTTLERKYQATEVHSVQNYHWLFLTETPKGWYMATLYSRFGVIDKNHPPTPPKETSEGILGQAIQIWLRDCRAKN